MIEKLNSYLKNLQALENIRNTTTGHIQIDYRIACAMYNFDFKPECPDGENSREIAKKIRSAKSIMTNPFEFLLSKQMNTKDLQRVTLRSINDFPRLRPSDICQNITLGTFQVRLAKSYIGDLIKNGRAYSVSEQFMKQVKKKLNNQEISKIVAVEIISRHKRSRIKAQCEAQNESESEAESNSTDQNRSFRTVYKVFVQYIPEGVLV